MKKSDINKKCSEIKKELSKKIDVMKQTGVIDYDVINFDTRLDLIHLEIKELIDDLKINIPDIRDWAIEEASDQIANQIMNNIPHEVIRVSWKQDPCKTKLNVFS